MDKTLFQKLIDRELPCHIVYEDAQVFAFLDIAPRSSGHTLVVPKEPAATMDDLTSSSAAALGAVLPRICRAVMEVSGSDAYNILQNNGSRAGQEVPHVHLHIVPKGHGGEGLTLSGSAGKLQEEEGRALAAKMRVLLLD